MLRHALRAFVLLFLMAPLAWAGNIALVLSDNGGPYSEFATALDNILDDTSWNITASGRPEAVDPAAARADLVVTVGSEAFRLMLARGGNIPLIATLLPRQSYEKILADHGKPRARVSAIYLDQPPARQAIFLRHLLPNHKRIGLLLSPETRNLAGQYRQALNNAGLSFDSEDSDNENALLPAVNTLLPRVSVLLAVPDSTIYRRDNIKAILVASYRHQRPVVAFSTAFVNAGAVAALYSTPAQIARQLADLLADRGLSLPAPMAPTLYSIAINHNVAQALGLPLPDETLIRRAMLADRDAR